MSKSNNLASNDCPEISILKSPEEGLGNTVISHASLPGSFVDTVLPLASSFMAQAVLLRGLLYNDPLLPATTQPPSEVAIIFHA